MNPAQLPPPIDGDPLSIETPEGTVRAYELGAGRTTLVLHSFNAAGSGEELAQLARSLSATRRVVLVDWLGFGTSDRPDVRYGPKRVYFDHRPSILQDYDLGRPMEVEAIVRAPVAFARVAGVATPTLDAIEAFVVSMAESKGLYAP